eukprot:INCI12396.1.p1 GENE.INCI12396.1~~INCI12396.1.p1  ORF type:complete len:413 (+),score=47.29 INCI12396.1:100-1239(+)
MWGASSLSGSKSCVCKRYLQTLAKSARAGKLLSRLGIRWPLIQAPMVGVSTPELAAAVSNAGALGSVGAGGSNPKEARALIHEMRTRTDKPFNINFFCHKPACSDPPREAAWLDHLAPFFDELGAQAPDSIRETHSSFVNNSEMLAMLLEEKPPIVSFHFGLPSQKAIDSLKERGVVVIGCATTVEEALLIEAAGLDAVVAQGVEAGGHRGVFDPENDRQIGTLALVQQIRQRTALPMIAAGGIMNGSSVAAMMALGADAVQMGTAFVLCPESSADDVYRHAMQSDMAYHTAITSNISGRPARGLVNRFHEPVSNNAPTLPDYPIPFDAGKALAAAAKAAGVTDFSVQWAGQGAPLARSMPAAQLVALLVEELEMARSA